ncbi:hypothetical protein RHGRI_028484 [Rhododendron griersonianum]|uniref:Transmembrane protein 230 n=1 Tax=Rhododendron griersonianum TaxID=479676 RepID=A0AAV6ILX4_9ERIC|nr:hypothetical protein RHGRI_028484 [Rhododendron griersonianum]
MTSMATKRNVRYTRLAADEDDYVVGGYDPRYDYAPKSFDKVPWKSIGLALFLLSLGCMLLFLSYFILTGHMGGDRSQGFYETRIAYYSWRGAAGYRFASIPDY